MIKGKDFKKFTVTDEASKTVLDKERIAEDVLWDGLHGVTNTKNDEA